MARLAFAFVLAALLAFSAPASAARKLPKGFLWGVATAGFPDEMGAGSPNDPKSDWWAWVRDPQNIQQKRVSGDLPESGPSQWAKYKTDVALPRTKRNPHAPRLS